MLDLIKNWWIVMSFQYNEGNEAFFALVAWSCLFMFFVMSFYIAFDGPFIATNIKG